MKPIAWVGVIGGLALVAACNRQLSATEPTLAPLPVPPSETAPPTGPLSTPHPPSGAPATAAPAPATAIGAGSDTCTNGAEFVEDMTIPDGSIFIPGETFEKVWSVRNTGSCDWGPEHRLVSLGEAVLDGPTESALFPARAGEIAEWRLSLRAPDSPGEYLARWQARGPDGVRFGDEVFVLIFVERPTPTPTLAPSPTP